MLFALTGRIENTSEGRKGNCFVFHPFTLLIHLIPFADCEIFDFASTLAQKEHTAQALTRSWVSVVLREWIMSERCEARSRRSLMGTAVHAANVHNTGTEGEKSTLYADI